MTLPIQQNEHGHSGRGLSWWSSFTNCPRRENLNNQLGLSQEESDILTPTGVGSVFHKILEYYYRGELDKIAWDLDNPNVVEALRLFGGYKLRFRPDEFGEVIGCEMDAVSGELSNAPTLSGPLGVQPFSARFDMVVCVDDKALASLSGPPRYLPLMEPGVYIIDTKTMGLRPSDIDQKLRMRLQFTAYQMLWNNSQELIEKYGPCKGFIANCVVKHKMLHDGSFFSVYCTPPSADQQQAVRSYLQYCFALREAHGENFANASRCDTYGICPHYTSGLCKRY